MIGPAKAALFKRLSIIVVASHSVILGTALLFAPGEVLAFVQWPAVADLFFVSQAGIFLVVLGFAYLAALWHRALVWLIVGSKLGAILFLFGQSFFVEARFHLILAGIGDAGLGLLVFVAVMVESGVRPDKGTSDSTDVADEHTAVPG